MRSRRVILSGAGRVLCLVLGVGVGVAALLASVALRTPAPREDPGRPAPLFFRGIDGGVVTCEAPRGGAAVLVFYSTECPISNAYGPTLNALYDAFPASSLRLVGVCVDRDLSDEEVAAHAREYGLKYPIVRDPECERAGRLGATVAPEAFVLDEQGRVRYQGRIDDRFADRGTRNATAGTNELKDAVAAVRAGRAVARPRVLAIGCPLPLPPVRRPARPEAPTYARDVAPILRQHCVECHQPGQVGPFPLLTYEQARKRAFDIAAVVRDYRMHDGVMMYRKMPPWKPAPGFGLAFRSSRVLAADRALTLLRWADANAPEGDSRGLPPRPGHPGCDGVAADTPDLVLEPARPCRIASDGADIDRRFVLPIELAEDRFVSAVAFQPGNPRIVRGMSCYFEDARDPLGAEWAEPLEGKANGLLGAWAPGQGPSRLPEGVGRLLPRQARVVLQVRYRPSGKPEEDRSRVALRFARGPVRRTIRWTAVGNAALELPPGQSRIEVAADWHADSDVELHAIFPIMRRLGRDLTVTATSPAGFTRDLIRINDWDPLWQTSYDLEQPLLLTGGSVVHVLAHYDNSEQNPRNPNRPPKRVRGGRSAADEACVVLLALTRPESAAVQRAGLGRIRPHRPLEAR